MTDQEIKQAAGDLNAASIKPRMVDGVGWCDAGCPQYTEPIARVLIRKGCGPPACAIPGPGSNTRWPVYEVCPVWAQRMSAWAEEARDRLKNGSFDSAHSVSDLLSRYPGKED